MGRGNVGTAQDAMRIRPLEKQKEAERRKLQERKKSASAGVQSGLLQDDFSRREKSRSKRNENDYCGNSYISRN
ncbi:hypothetical protein MUK42_09373 [Musa troglodytarum]|uniref:Uncharacterized protein n=1 Tax=Musa troglodytarum TaxID=320322 RepID=A0A9E7E9D0_9LILI|nr:hypothetical protein MUK42_09373 [Musa troglodytarum]